MVTFLPTVGEDEAGPPLMIGDTRRPRFGELWAELLSAPGRPVPPPTLKAQVEGSLPASREETRWSGLAPAVGMLRSTSS